VRGESGCGGRLGSPSASPSAAPDCCVGGGIGDACAAPPVPAATEAGTGGEVVFLEIRARAGAASGTFGGGMAGELSW
jgi:hypothetical protein